MRMQTRLCEMQHKEIVNLKDGAVLGFVDDILISTGTAQVESLIVCGRPRLFGLLGKQADLVVLDQDLFEVQPSQFPQVKVLETVLNGVTVYQA